MFSALNPTELGIVIDAIQNIRFPAGQPVIKEGDDGEDLYVVESGTLACTKVFVSKLFAQLIFCFILERKH